MSQYNEYGGGGFLQGGSPYAGSSPDVGRNKEASHSLRPLTVAQASKATQAHADAEWNIGDVEIGQITLVGQVVTIQPQATNYVYWIDDGSGRIEARLWHDPTNEEDTGKWDGIEELKYVRVTGSLKTFGSRRYINATNIRVAQDPHEIYFHILEAMTVTLMIDKGISSVSAHTSTPAETGIASAYSTHQSITASDQYSYLPPLQQKIARFISTQPRSEEGVHVSIIARAIGTEGDAERISNALDKLMDEGLVYTTMDDSHFQLSL